MRWSTIAGIAVFAAAEGDVGGRTGAACSRFNLTGPFLCTRAAVPFDARWQWRRHRQTSPRSRRWRALDAAFGLRHQQGGARASHQALAVRARFANIRVNAVAPGPVDTAMAKQVHTPEIRARLSRRHPAQPLRPGRGTRGSDLLPVLGARQATSPVKFWPSMAASMRLVSVCRRCAGKGGTGELRRVGKGALAPWPTTCSGFAVPLVGTLYYALPYDVECAESSMATRSLRQSLDDRDRPARRRTRCRLRSASSRVPADRSDRSSILFEKVRREATPRGDRRTCLSACTLVLSIVPGERICVTKRAVFGFHAARSVDRRGRLLCRAGGIRSRAAKPIPARLRDWISPPAAAGPRGCFCSKGGNSQRSIPVADDCSDSRGAIVHRTSRPEWTRAFVRRLGKVPLAVDKSAYLLRKPCPIYAVPISPAIYDGPAVF